MKPETKYQAILISYILILVWAFVIFSLSMFGNDKLGPLHYQFMFIEMTRYVALFLAILVIVLRVFNVIKSKTNLLMIFTGILNGFVGLLAFLPLIAKSLASGILVSYLLNLALGMFIFADVFKKRIRKTIANAVNPPMHSQV